MALDKNGKLFVFGSNSYGQLGIQGRLNKVNEPHKVLSSSVADFACGEEHSAFIDQNGHVYTWGYGCDGQLGHGNKNNVSIPMKLQNFDQKARIVKCGAGHTGIITD